MIEAPPHSVFSIITDFLATNPSPEAILAYRLPAELEARAHDLAERNGEGELSQEERDEMLDYVRIENMMLLLKAKIMRKLQHAT